ncbi:DUF1707 SHOCT-like domain-containing protein [Nakamurella leprariae]|uniref:DUF1707 domain-containing protein n=1 Tax=Nakamurella leprariae TaxID=2803911 RepID=A0A939BZ17_9ACTN|nr:DUF1707 domain-containing protein [Nakamurella leprariae]MBM9467680.1 DUF1707 domain-containing protein [Nakamurella leprariae]
MTAPQPPGNDPADRNRVVRVGDQERNAALEALGEHLSAGRLDLDEYGERSAKVTQARTVADLQELFDDLPAPHPQLSGWALPAVRAGSSPAVSGGAPMPPQPFVPNAPVKRSRGQTAAAIATGVSVPVAFGLFMLLLTIGVPGGVAWIAWLLIPIVGGIANAVQNDQRPPNRD